ncbi:MAG: hypothetical protein ACOCQD_03860 [archaeon]
MTQDDLLYQVYCECSEKDWDCYDAFPITETTYLNTRNFLKQLPLEITKEAEPGSEPDGSLTLGWYVNKDYQISVSIDEKNHLYYAAAIGNSKASGEFNLSTTDDISELLKLIKQILKQKEGHQPISIITIVYSLEFEIRIYLGNPIEITVFHVFSGNMGCYCIEYRKSYDNINSFKEALIYSGIIIEKYIQSLNM